MDPSASGTWEAKSFFFPMMTAKLPFQVLHRCVQMQSNVHRRLALKWRRIKFFALKPMAESKPGSDVWLHARRTSLSANLAQRFILFTQ